MCLRNPCNIAKKTNAFTFQLWTVYEAINVLPYVSQYEYWTDLLLAIRLEFKTKTPKHKQKTEQPIAQSSVLGIQWSKYIYFKSDRTEPYKCKCLFCSISYEMQRLKSEWLIGEANESDWTQQHVRIHRSKATPSFKMRDGHNKYVLLFVFNLGVWDGMTLGRCSDSLVLTHH